MIEKTIEGIVHNRFDVEVRDARTGELKQEAKGYNVVLDNYFNLLFDNASPRLYSIGIGSGTGVPKETDINFFNFVGSKYADVVEKVKGYPTSYIKKKMVLNPEQYVGISITEVGFCNFLKTVVTKSMLKDSEGNNIAILKTATDIITIYATFYFTFNNIAEGCVFPKNPINNNIIYAIIDDSTLGGASIYLSHQSPDYEDEREKGLIESVGSAKGKGSLTTMKYTYPKARFNYNVCNGYMIEGIGAGGYAFWKFPNSKLLPNIPLTEIAIGIGDGVKNKFASPIPRIVKDSEIVKVNNVVQEKGVEYTFKYDVNGAMFPQYFESNGDVIIAPLTGYSHFHKPFCLKKYGNGNYFGDYFLEFKESKKINTIKIWPNVFASYSSSKLSLSYSIDNNTWTKGFEKDLFEVKDGLVEIFERIEARYWKINATGTSNNLKATPNIMIAYTEPEITFITPPPQDAVITMDCEIDRPLKNENWVIDFGFSIQFQRG